jgi:choline dehydrogenase-like flavoprotein
MGSDEYDYVVVGGGAGGSVLARRLGDAGKSVLLLEAGGRPNSLKITIPAGILRLFKSKFDWDFTSENEPCLDGRGVYLCRGKVRGALAAVSTHA